MSEDRTLVERGGMEKLLAALRAAEAEQAALRADAERWRAFSSSARFKMIGSANFDHSAYPEVTVKADRDPREWLHFGLEVWDKHPAGEDQQGEHGRHLLNTYVEHRRAELATEQADVADGETLHAALIRHIERGLGQNDSAVPTGDAMSEKLERFFDTVFEIAPEPPVPYSRDEIQQFFTKTAELLAADGVKIRDEEGEEESKSRLADAADYSTLAVRVGISTEKALRDYMGLDTYARGCLYWEDVGIDERRFTATLQSFDIDARFY